MSSNLLDRHYLTSLFEPESVAIVGGSERPGSIGAVLVENMKAAPCRGMLQLCEEPGFAISSGAADPLVMRATLALNRA